MLSKCVKIRIQCYLNYYQFLEMVMMAIFYSFASIKFLAFILLIFFSFLTLLFHFSKRICLILWFLAFGSTHNISVNLFIDCGKPPFTWTKIWIVEKWIYLRFSCHKEPEQSSRVQSSRTSICHWPLVLLRSFWFLGKCLQAARERNQEGLEGKRIHQHSTSSKQNFTSVLGTRILIWGWLDWGKEDKRDVP